MLLVKKTNVNSKSKQDHNPSRYFLYKVTGESDTTTPFFCKLWNTIYREIINIMTIMMKTIKERLNLYTKNILMGWGPVYF
jgi:hypothetical protein